MTGQKMTQQVLNVALEREQYELFSRMQSEFWHGLFCEILKKHTYQNDFYFLEKNLPMSKVLESMKGMVYDLCHIYGLECKETFHGYRTELKFKFNYYDYKNQKDTMDELSIVICKKDITIRILPHNPLLKLFQLEEYVLVENIVKDMCAQLFGNLKEKFLKLEENYKKIKVSSEGLTPKTIEIAQNSIRTLYQSSREKYKNLVQRNLYSNLLIKGQMIRIFHRDFLKDPNVLMRKFMED